MLSPCLDGSQIFQVDDKVINNHMSLYRLPLCAERINRQYHDYSLLDVGCRNMDLKPLLNNCREYFGADRTPGDGIFECDLETELPFDDDSFDIVTALDVLEHLDNPHQALYELYRVARWAVLISLPNMYYITFRINFLRGLGLSGKYSFPATPVTDRHRWVLSYQEALQFVHVNADGHTIDYEMILPARGRSRAISQPIERWLGNRWPNLFAYGILFEVRLNQGR